jgi:hypothetical protein
MDPRVQISDHITYKEATESETAEKLGIDNTPSDEILGVMKITALKVFEPIRRFWKCPIWISSFFRCPEVNEALGKSPLKASKNSQHMAGEAMDIDAQVLGNITNRQVFEYIRDNCRFDQLIWEEGDDNEPEWVHVSYKANANRMMVLRKYKIKGKISYRTL